MVALAIPVRLGFGTGLRHNGQMQSHRSIRDPRPVLRAPVGAVCFDWGGTLMVDNGPAGIPMCRWPEVAAVTGALDCLTVLHNRVPLCVATNAAQSDRRMVEMALDRVDLLRFINRVFCFNEIGFLKDRPEFWSAVSRDLGLPPAEFVMIGDSIEHDVRAPLRSGFQAVWFNEHGIHPESAVAIPAVSNLRMFAGMIVDLLEKPLSI